MRKNVDFKERLLHKYIFFAIFLSLKRLKVTNNSLKLVLICDTIAV